MQNRRAARRQRRQQRQVFVLAVVMFLLTSLALALSAIRTYLVLLVIALPIVYLVMRGRRAWKVLIPAMLLVAVGLGALSQIDPDSIGKDGAEAGIRRVIVALNDPFASHEENTDNTLQLHWENAEAGVREAFEHPVGHGTGTTGISGEHFGVKSRSTDFDISDAGIAFGLVGLFLAAAIVVVGLWTSIRVALSGRTFERVALVGILLVSFGAWFQGAHYVMAPLLWLLLGRADAAVVRRRAAASLAPAEPADRRDGAPPVTAEPAPAAAPS
jgi:cell division protein FtsW (lipid II flippase)